MSFEEFKGWLKGYLESDSGVDSDRILEELEKVEAAPVGILPTPFWPVYQIYPQPQGPVWVEPYITWTSGDSLTVPVGNEETVAQFNKYKAN